MKHLAILLFFVVGWGVVAFDSGRFYSANYDAKPVTESKVLCHVSPDSPRQFDGRHIYYGRDDGGKECYVVVLIGG